MDINAKALLFRNYIEFFLTLIETKVTTRLENWKLWNKIKLNEFRYHRKFIVKKIYSE